MTPHRSTAAWLAACCLAFGAQAQQADPPPPQAQPSSIQPLRKPPPASKLPEGMRPDPSPQAGAGPTLGVGAAPPQIQVPLKRPAPDAVAPPPGAVARAPVLPPAASAGVTGGNAARCEAMVDAGQRAKCRDDLAHESAIPGGPRP